MAAAKSPLEQASLARVGTVLRGKWRIDALIGIGGMAAVYSATHRNGKRVAIKVLHSNFLSNQEACERFLREGYAANRVGHPGAVAVLDDDHAEDGAAFLVMELLEGRSLESRIAEAGRLDSAEVLFIADQLLDVLSAAHAKGIVHRDIKPDNVFLLCDGRVKVLDFGFARLANGPLSGKLTRDGLVIGTVSFMSPEQAQAQHHLTDRQSDLWSVGATMFYALTGRTVHEGVSMVDRLMLAMRQPARSLGSVRPDLPGEVIALVDRALAWDRQARWPDASTMRAAARFAFDHITGQPIPGTQRTEYGGVAGWLRPVRPALGVAYAGSNASMLEVSVVFEPESTAARGRS